MNKMYISFIILIFWTSGYGNSFIIKTPSGIKDLGARSLIAFGAEGHVFFSRRRNHIYKVYSNVNIMKKDVEDIEMLVRLQIPTIPVLEFSEGQMNCQGKRRCNPYVKKIALSKTLKQVCLEAKNGHNFDQKKLLSLLRRIKEKNFFTLGKEKLILTDWHEGNIMVDKKGRWYLIDVFVEKYDPHNFMHILPFPQALEAMIPACKGVIAFDKI
jgi:hypothetical protein